MGATLPADGTRASRIISVVVIIFLLIGLIAVGGFAGITYWSKLEIERDLKQTSLEREAERKERVKLTRNNEEANEAQRDAERVSNFTLSLFAPGKAEASGESYRVIDALDLAVKRLDNGEFDRKPALELQLRRTIGRAFESFGLLDAAEPQLRRVVELTGAIHGEQDPAMIESVQDLATVLLAKGESEEGALLRDQSLSLYEMCMQQTPWGRVPRLYAIVQRMVEAGQHLNAAFQIDYAITVLNRQFGPDHPLIYQAMIRKAGILEEGEQLVESESVFRATIEHLRQCLPPTHPHIADALAGFTKLLTKTRRFDEAEQAARECLTIREASLPSSDWRRSSAKCLVGEVLFARDEYAEAEPLLTEGLRELIATADAPAARREALRSVVIDFYERWEKPEKAEEYRQLRTSAPAAREKQRQRPGLSIE